MVSQLLRKGSFRISFFWFPHRSTAPEFQVLGPSNMSYLRASLRLQHVLPPSLPFLFFKLSTSVRHLKTCAFSCFPFHIFSNLPRSTPEHFRSGVSVSALSEKPTSTGCSHLLTLSNLAATRLTNTCSQPFSASIQLRQTLPQSTFYDRCLHGDSIFLHKLLVSLDIQLSPTRTAVS